MKQIEALIREKESRSATQQKIDSRLLYLIKMSRGEAIADDVPTLDTGLKGAEQGFIEGHISANVTKKLLAVLQKQMNAEIIASFPQYHNITARMPLAEIENLAARSDIIFIQPKLDATTNRTTDKRLASPLINSLGEMSTIDSLNIHPANFKTRAARVREFLTTRLADDQLTGTVTSQADMTHRAP